MSFRRMLALLAVVFLFAGIAAAQAQTDQPLQCSSVAQVTPMLRAEGMTELVGDIVITCTGGSAFIPTAQTPFIPTANVLVALTNKVTSRLTNAASSISEAVLLVDEPGTNTKVVVAGYGPAAAQTLCSNPVNPNSGNACQQRVAWAEPNGTIVASSSTTGAITGTPTATSIQVPLPSGATGVAPNVFQGIQVGTNQIEFRGIPVLPPVSSGVSRVYRITNIRVAANGALPVNNASGVLQVWAYLSNSGSTSLPLANGAYTNSFVVGFVSNSLTTSVTRAANVFTQCQTIGTPTLAGVLRFNEKFPSAFKTRYAPITTTAYSYGGASGSQSGPTFSTPFPVGGSPFQNTPGVIYNSESGLIINSTANIGIADTGTRFQAFLDKLPRGANVYVSRANLVTSSEGKLDLSTAPTSTASWKEATPASSATGILSTTYAEFTDPRATGKTINSKADGKVFSPMAVTTTVGAIPLIDVTPVAYDSNNLGSTYVTWEALQSNPSTNETLDFGVFVSYTPAFFNNVATPIVETNSVASLGYGQQSVNDSASATDFIPRFYNGMSDPSVFFNVVRCQTLLLFPYVTTAAGFNTGYAIANTAKDPLSTPYNIPDNKCDLYAYGRWASAADQVDIPKFTVAVPVGTVTTGLLSASIGTSSTGNKEFTGYMFASCNFQFAHGFAYISDFGQYSLGATQGYLALIVNNNNAPAVRPNIVWNSEALNN